MKKRVSNTILRKALVFVFMTLILSGCSFFNHNTNNDIEADNSQSENENQKLYTVTGNIINSLNNSTTDRTAIPSEPTGTFTYTVAAISKLQKNHTIAQ